MRDYQNNIYGMGKVDETEVRSGSDIALSTSAGALQGAKAGAAFGVDPTTKAIGAGIGALAGGGAMLYANMQGKQDEILQNQADQTRNKFIDNLSGRAMRTDRVTPAQLEQGMNTGKYVMAEIEGDGSNRYEEGIGEIVVDKNFNLKYNAAGDPTHEEGGKELMLEEGDVVFPTQNSKEKYRKIKNAISRYKLNGDEKAKRYLEKERDKLPTDEDYDKQEEMMASQGMRMYEYGSGGIGPYTLPPGNRNRDLETSEQKAERKRLLKEDRKQSRLEKKFEKDVNRTVRALERQGRKHESNLGIANKSKDVADSGDAGKAADQIGSYNNPLKYASVIKNTIEGTEAAEKTTRRYLEAQPYEYRDTSAAKRRSAMEQRNYMQRAMEGRVDRSGSLGTSAQLQSQYRGQMEAINEAEAAKQLATQQANTQLMNQVSQANTQMDVRYDEMDAQNRAARQAFQSTAAAETAELAQYDEQRRYMRDLDEARMDMDERSLKYIGSRRYGIDPTTGEVAYKAEKGMKVSKPAKKKSNQLKPGSYRMLPDGTIIIE